MKRHGFVFLLIFSIFIKGFASGDLRIAGSRSAAMGGCSVSISDLWSLQNNPAGTAWLTRLSTGISYGNRFLVKELSAVAFGIALPVKAGTFGLLISRYGSSDYTEIKAGLSFARKFGRHFSTGVLLDYQRIGQLEQYGSKSLFSFELGFQYRASKHISVGFHLMNPVPVKILSYPEQRLPTLIRLGLCYEFSAAFQVCIEAEKDLEHQPTFRAGAEYHFAKPAFIRIGVSTNPMAFSFGFGIILNGFILDFATGYQQVIGFSPGMSLIWQTKREVVP